MKYCRISYSGFLLFIFYYSSAFCQLDFNPTYVGESSSIGGFRYLPPDTCIEVSRINFSHQNSSFTLNSNVGKNFPILEADISFTFAPKIIGIQTDTFNVTITWLDRAYFDCESS